MEQNAGIAAIVLAVIGYIIQHNIFVKPEGLEKAKAEVLREVDSKIKEFRETNCKDHKSEAKERFDLIQTSNDKQFEEIKKNNDKQFAEIKSMITILFQRIDEINKK